ncbi:hypothetical protein M407DRAFT_241113 [Tulasnella calospora MUT 4182]|uniref:D-lactate dehydratase n=1 Tax=Tulasnella calospora MUT 4182 TaxID=1051891 RepID=A0A0C3LH69_9AGAM|nr:hypothetical protein M407DRAFT_241113 [Tulasnella calospora MUT 4182]
MSSALILIANGTEEMEFVITYDTLVRAGINCTSALVNDIPDTLPTPSPVAKCSRGVKIIADKDLADVEDPNSFDALIIPGGAKGADTLSQSKKVQGLIRAYLEKDRVVGMICAGSLAALRASLPRSKITSHPSVKADLGSAFEYSEDDVVVAGKLITSRGPGTAFLFALTLVEALVGPEKRKEVYGPMVFPPGYYTTPL